jgi:multidrug efflux pump subunit AcrA (membrane-fusion protein)
MNYRRALPAAALFALSSTLPAQEAKPEAKEEKKDPPAETAAAGEHVVKAGAFEIVHELDALFAPLKQHQISIVPKAWADWTVLDALPHGTKVKKGQPLLTLNTEPLEKAIKEAELAEPAAKLALQIAEAELATLEKMTPVQLEAARRTKRIADENWAHYEKVGHAETIKAAKRSSEFAQRGFDYAKEELEQLEKMYEADDLTEETEEIILKRARNDFERAKESLRLSKMRSERELKVEIPRARIAKKAEVEAGALAYHDSVHNLPRQLDQKRHAVTKAKRDRGLAVLKLRDMQRDLAAMKVVAPADGIVYYGVNRKGSWATAATVAKKLLPGGKVSPREVFMTVAETSPLGLIASVPEEKLAGLRAGLRGKAKPISNPSLSVPVKVTEVSYVPGAFTATLSTDGEFPQLFPGMKAKAKIQIAKFDKAITVPNGLLDRDSVWVKDGDEKKRRKVKTGPTDGKVTVILNGLKDGETVVPK